MSIIEGDPGDTTAAKVNVSLSGPAVATITVTVLASLGTTQTGDYRHPKPIRVTFKPGQWQKAVSVKLTPDDLREADETIILALSAPSTGLALGSHATGTIMVVDDDD